jgi:hypothetical protein
VGRFDIVAGDSLTLGNRPGGGQPFEGRVYYAALYREYFEAEKVANKAADLLIDDDTP